MWSCESVWFYKPKKEDKDTLRLNENISVNKIEQAVETNNQNLEFNKKSQKEKIIEPEKKKKNHCKNPRF